MGIKVIHKHTIKEVSVLKKDKRSLSNYLRNNWKIVYEGTYGVTLQKEERYE